jgi:putative iron-only hydrogenase system regulator
VNGLETRVALIGIVVEDESSVEKLNSILHQYKEYIIGRMGIPYQKRDFNLISIAIDAPADVISTLAGKIGMLKGVTSKSVYAKHSGKGESDEKSDR